MRGVSQNPQQVQVGRCPQRSSILKVGMVLLEKSNGINEINMVYGETGEGRAARLMHFDGQSRV